MRGSSIQKRSKPADPRQGSRTRDGLERCIRRRITAKGELDLPCIPALVDSYLERLVTLWAALGNAFSTTETTALRAVLLRGLEHGYALSPQASVVIHSSRCRAGSNVFDLPDEETPIEMRWVVLRRR